MGTLFNQPERGHQWVQPDDVTNEIEEMKKIARSTGVSLDQVIKVRAILEQERRNNLYKTNGDVFDEQMAGIGHLFNSLIDAIETRGFST